MSDTTFGTSPVFRRTIASPNKPRASSNLADGPPTDGPRARCPLRSSSGHGANLPPRHPDKLRAFAIPANRRLSGFWPALITLGPDGISGNRFGPDTLRASVIFAKDGLRAHGPTCPPSAGQSPLLPLLPPPANRDTFPDKTHLSRHDKQAYSKPVSPGAKCRRNGSAIHRPISCGLPRRPVCVFAAAS